MSEENFKENRIIKQVLILAECCILLSTLMGCQTNRTSRDIDAVVKEDGEFLEFLAGT